ncbi:MAG: hypothetical protein EHM36_06175 [Deltaproteobacteria bacterium]|nr:MAG: hypothetical protein EHM36_06175 [Deltaproteobacteria bacterium]
MNLSRTGILLFCLLLLSSSGFNTGEASAQSSSLFRDQVKEAIKKFSASVIDTLSKNDNRGLQATLNRIVSDDQKEGKAIRFGIGILDREGLVVAGRHALGMFREGEDFSRYNFWVKAFKRKKIVSDRLFFQDQSEILIVCVPLVRKKNLVGALILGFDPSEIKKDYGLTTDDFMSLKFNP